MHPGKDSTVHSFQVTRLRYSGASCRLRRRLQSTSFLAERGQTFRRQLMTAVTEHDLSTASSAPADSAAAGRPIADLVESWFPDERGWRLERGILDPNDVAVARDFLESRR